MKPWLQGDFGDLQPKGQMEALRDFVQTAAHRGLDLHPFWLGLAQVDLIACADLAVGPKAVAHPVAVESTLVVVEALEKVIAPSGLYSRLLQLSPTNGPRLAELAARRFPEESWIWRLDTGPVKGSRILEVHEGTPYFEQSCRRAVRAGFWDALSFWVNTDNMRVVLRAAMAAKGPGATIHLARMALPKHSADSVLAVLSALMGPRLDERLVELMPALRESSSLVELQAILSGFPSAECWVTERLI